MKKIIIGFAVLSSIAFSAMAADKITGKVWLEGKDVSVSIDTNINTGKLVKLGATSFSIHQINSSEIHAQNEKSEIAVYIGEPLEAIFDMKVDQLVDYFNLSNRSDVNCYNMRAKAFLVLTEGNKSIGNCVF